MEIANVSKEKFGQTLLKSRRDKGLTQKNCAKYVGVSVYAYQMWERGCSVPKEDHMIGICELLNINKEEVS